jgi:uncharacterized membrane protein YphA (DoxX/SURF4 family)
MGMRLRHRDPVVQGTPAAPATRPTRGSSIARTLRTARWPRFLAAGLVLTVVGVTLLSGTAQALVALGGAVVFLVAAVIGLGGKGWDRDSRNEPPMPPGGGGAPFGG